MTRTSIASIVIALSLGNGGCAEHLGEFEPFREVACFEGAAISLKDAIAAAEAGDGRAIDADYRQDEEMGCLEGVPGAYDVTLLMGGRISVVSVDAKSRQIGPRAEAGALNALLGGGSFEGSPSNMVPLVPRLRIDMSQAIDLAEQQGGKAMVAWVEAKNGKAGYTIKLVQRGRVRVIWMDGERGT